MSRNGLRASRSAQYMHGVVKVLRRDPRFWEVVADDERDHVTRTLNRLEAELRGSGLLALTTREQRAAFRSLRIGAGER
ncbi:hypothetical protein [Janibacter melonis]|uniref:hypothetical protein n=1 Tax=Janibacter melonis TaxID=262209 RepID=UPI00174C2E56|nr:hypothetical protein [Janibacter melonis]